VGLLAGCGLDSVYQCRSSDQCVLAGQTGVCEPSGYCSFFDSSCASGRRYGRWAPVELSEACVSDAGLPVDLGSDLTGDPDLSVDLGADMRPPDMTGVPPDMTVMPPDMGTCPAGAVICDDFETGNANKWTLDVEAPSTGAIDTVRPRTGLYSFHGTSPVNGSVSSKYMLRKPYSKAPPMMIASRVWLYAQTQLGRFGLFMGLMKGADYITAGTDSTNKIAITQNDPTDQISGTTMPGGQWVCFELVVEYPNASTTGARVRLFLGQTQVLDFVPVAYMSSGDVVVGTVRAPGDDPLVIFEDDVTAAYERLPCP
jgi:hypothetical protein